MSATAVSPPPRAASSATNHGSAVGGPAPSSPVACQAVTRRGQVGRQAGLVLVHRQEVVPPPVQDQLADLALRLQGVPSPVTSHPASGTCVNNRLTAASSCPGPSVAS